jgi:DNA-binding FrmR family transcriptional regulator
MTKSLFASAIMLSISTNYSATSGDAYLELLQKQMENARKNAEAIDQLSSRTDLDQKALARQRVKEIKEQIEALRRMLMLFGGKDAKAVLQQLKQLGSQLKQAAGVLQASSETGLPDATAISADTSVPSAESETSDAYSEGRNAYAEQQASADAEAAGVVLAASSDPQRAEDDRQLEAAAQALKSLRSSLERMIKNGADRR